jgi:hypothetical protein
MAIPPHPREHRARVHEARGLPLGEVDLGHVARDDGLGAEADAREEHLHLLGRGVLRLVEDHERVVERAPAHEGERCDLDGSPLEGAHHLVVAHEVVERVVQRPQIRIDLLRQVARQEPQLLARLDRRARQHDALHGVALERVDRGRDREEGLARPCGSDAEGDIECAHRLQILGLARRARGELGAARQQ